MHSQTLMWKKRERINKEWIKMKNASELLEEAVYAGNLSENEEERLYSWIESLILAKRKSDEYEARAEAFDAIVGKYEGIMKDVRNRKFKVTSDVTLLGLEAEKAIMKYAESGEPNELRE